MEGVEAGSEGESLSFVVWATLKRHTHRMHSGNCSVQIWMIDRRSSPSAERNAHTRDTVYGVSGWGLGRRTWSPNEEAAIMASRAARMQNTRELSAGGVRVRGHKLRTSSNGERKDAVPRGGPAPATAAKTLPAAPHTAAADSHLLESRARRPGPHPGDRGGGVKDGE